MLPRVMPRSPWVDGLTTAMKMCPMMRAVVRKAQGPCRCPNAEPEREQVDADGVEARHADRRQDGVHILAAVEPAHRRAGSGVSMRRSVDSHFAAVSCSHGA